MEKTFTGVNGLRWKGCLPKISRNSTNILCKRGTFVAAPELRNLSGRSMI